MKLWYEFEIKVYSPIMASMIPFGLPESFYFQHPESRFLKTGYRTLTGELTQEQHDEFLEWAGTNMDIKVIGIRVVDPPIPIILPDKDINEIKYEPSATAFDFRKRKDD